MALPRICSVGRGLIFRGPTTRVATTISLFGRITVPHRSFTSASRHLQEAVQSSSSANAAGSASQVSIPEEQRRKNARSVKVLKVPRRAVKSTIEAFFNDAGFQVADTHLDIDRFRYEGTTHASVELANEQQVQKAIKELDRNASLGNEVYLRALNPDFSWNGYQPKKYSEYSYMVRQDESGIRQAVMPLLEGRRVRLSLKFPAWGKGGRPVQRLETDREAVIRAFDRFGIEAISRPSPVHGETTYQPKFYCHIDFTTKQGADEAIEALHDKEYEGVLVWVRLSQVDAKKAYQIGRLDKSWLAKLQEKGLAPPDSEIHEDWVSKTAKKDPKDFDRHRNWTDPENPPKKPTYKTYMQTTV